MTWRFDSLRGRSELRSVHMAEEDPRESPSPSLNVSVWLNQLAGRNVARAR